MRDGSRSDPCPVVPHGNIPRLVREECQKGEGVQAQVDHLDTVEQPGHDVNGLGAVVEFHVDVVVRLFAHRDKVEAGQDPGYFDQSQADHGQVELVGRIGRKGKVEQSGSNDVNRNEEAGRAFWQIGSADRDEDKVEEYANQVEPRILKVSHFGSLLAPTCPILIDIWPCVRWPSTTASDTWSNKSREIEKTTLGNRSTRLSQ